MPDLVCTCGAVLDPEAKRVTCSECGQLWELWRRDGVPTWIPWVPWRAVR